MITDAYNLAEVLFAAFIGAFAGGVGVFIATMAVRRDAALDRIEAAGDLGAARAAQIAMEASRSYLVLAPAYQAHTAEYRMVDPDHDSTPGFDAWLATANADADAAVAETVDTTAALAVLKQRAGAAGLILDDTGPQAACCAGHGGDEPCIPDAGYALPCCGSCPDRIHDTNLVPVTADDLAPIGPDQMPAMTWRRRAQLAAAALPVLVALVLLAVASLVWLGWDRLAEHRAARRAQRAIPVIEAAPEVEMELAHPAPPKRKKYEALHRAGR